jgi:hypothetical protein
MTLFSPPARRSFIAVFSLYSRFVLSQCRQRSHDSCAKQSFEEEEVAICLLTNNFHCCQGLGNFFLNCYYSQCVHAYKPFDHAWFEFKKSKHCTILDPITDNFKASWFCRVLDRFTWKAKLIWISGVLVYINVLWCDILVIYYWCCYIMFIWSYLFFFRHAICKLFNLGK